MSFNLRKNCILFGITLIVLLFSPRLSYQGLKLSKGGNSFVEKIIVTGMENLKTPRWTEGTKQTFNSLTTIVRNSSLILGLGFSGSYGEVKSDGGRLNRILNSDDLFAMFRKLNYARGDEYFFSSIGSNGGIMTEDIAAPIQENFQALVRNGFYSDGYRGAVSNYLQLLKVLTNICYWTINNNMALKESHYNNMEAFYYFLIMLQNNLREFSSNKLAGHFNSDKYDPKQMNDAISEIYNFTAPNGVIMEDSLLDERETIKDIFVKLDSLALNIYEGLSPEEMKFYEIELQKIAKLIVVLKNYLGPMTNNHAIQGFREAPLTYFRHLHRARSLLRLQHPFQKSTTPDDYFHFYF